MHSPNPQQYLETLRTLSERLVAVQKPIRILDAIKWSPEIEQRFRASGGRELPAVDAGFYQRQPLSFDPDGQVAGDSGSVFTKDIAYVKGFVENVNYIRSAIVSGVPEIIPMLFVGKVTLDDRPLLYERYLEGVVAGPKYLPSVFRDLNGLYVWFGFASGLSLMNIPGIQKHFGKLFEQLPATAPIYTGQTDAELD